MTKIVAQIRILGVVREMGNGNEITSENEIK